MPSDGFFKSLLKMGKKSDSHEVIQATRQASVEAVLNSERLFMASLVQSWIGQCFTCVDLCYYAHVKPKRK